MLEEVQLLLLLLLLLLLRMLLLPHRAQLPRQHFSTAAVSFPSLLPSLQLFPQGLEGN